MKYADYRPYLPGPEQSRIAGDDSVSHTKGRLALPRAQKLFAEWDAIAAQPFVGVTTDGKKIDGLYPLRDEGAPAEAMAAAAWRLIETFSANDRARAIQPVESQLWWMWQNTEMFVEKHGLRLETASPVQRELVLAVLKTSLSDRGFGNAVGAMQLNAFLGELLGAPGVLNEWSYNFCLYGTPSTAAPWGWQIWGHHLSISCVVIGTQMVLTPCFVGAEICYADQGRFKGVTLFQDEERLGLELMNSLPEEFQRKARLGFDLGGADLPAGRVHFADYLMLGGAHQDNRVVPLEGIEAGRFSAGHRNRLLDLVQAYIGAMPKGPRDAKMADVERHLSETHFCWIGDNGPTDPFYYRIQSPVLLIEFDHHPGLFLTNREALKFHVHTVVRSPNGNDYGVDVLRQHYAHSHGDGHHGHTHAHDGGHHHHGHDRHHDDESDGHTK